MIRRRMQLADDLLSLSPVSRPLYPPPMHCPVCKREFESETSAALPFCSERCRTIDSGRWLGEVYHMPVPPDPDADELPEDAWVERDSGGED